MANIRYIEDLNGLFKALGNKKLTLVGHSWGGMLSFSYAWGHIYLYDLNTKKLKNRITSSQLIGKI